jgi:hypothetical protein
LSEVKKTSLKQKDSKPPVSGKPLLCGKKRKTADESAILCSQHRHGKTKSNHSAMWEVNMVRLIISNTSRCRNLTELETERKEADVSTSFRYCRLGFTHPSISTWDQCQRIFFCSQWDRQPTIASLVEREAVVGHDSRLQPHVFDATRPHCNSVPSQTDPYGL